MHFPLVQISFLMRAHRVVQTLVKWHYELRVGRIKVDQAPVITSATRAALQRLVVRYQNFSLLFAIYLADICSAREDHLADTKKIDISNTVFAGSVER